MAYRRKEKGVRIKITRNQMIFVLVVVAIVVSIILYDLYFPKPITAINYDSIVLGFRADLREAKNVPVYPSEEILYNELMDPLIENITIAAKEAGEKNEVYLVQTFEIVSKLEIVYLKLGLGPTFNKQPLIIESYEGLSGEPQKPIIALVHPSYSDETAIRVEDHVIYVKARDYKDFDLVVIKLLMVVLDLDI